MGWPAHALAHPRPPHPPRTALREIAGHPIRGARAAWPCRSDARARGARGRDRGSRGGGARFADDLAFGTRLEGLLEDLVDGVDEHEAEGLAHRGGDVL